MTDQEKREKVIKGLKKMNKNSGCIVVYDKDCKTCPYERVKGKGCCSQIIDDAIALLKAQEPRVMTLEEALNSLVIEYRSGKLREVGKHVFTEGAEYYGIIWRVWDKMPTDEQREKEPWDDAEH